MKPTLDPFADGYTVENAHFMARCASLAYSDSRSVRTTLRRWGLRRCRFIDVDDTQCAVAGNDDVVVVAFRGTEPKVIRDWFTDAKIDLTGGPLGMVHEGFALALASVWVKLVQAIADYQDEGQSLWFTGHSLGGALATLAVAKLREKGRPVRALYSFGSPRVGDETFARNFQAKMPNRAYRLVNNNDVVTRVASRLIRGYRHVGEVHYFDADGVDQGELNGWSRFLDRVHGRVEDFLDLGPDGIKDHSMELYIANLERGEADGAVA